MSRRVDGTEVKGLPHFRRVFPYVMRTRTESVIYFPMSVDAEPLLAFLEQREQQTGNKDVRLFHVLLSAGIRTLFLRPEMNRFVSGKKIFQRNEIVIAFVSKAKFSDEGEERNVKLSFSGQETLEQVAKKVQQAVSISKEEYRKEKSSDDKDMAFFFSFPSFLRSFVFRFLRFLDHFGWLPAKMVKGEPFFSSVFVTNVGSIGLDAPFHHLYEWGNTPLFLAVGQIRPQPVVAEDQSIQMRRMMNLRATFDERIADGFYCAKSLQLFQQLLEHPEMLENPPTP